MGRQLAEERRDALAGGKGRVRIGLKKRLTEPLSASGVKRSKTQVKQGGYAMFQNIFLNWLTGMAGKRLDGRKTQVGGVALILAALCQVIMAMFPDITIPGMEHVDWDTTIGMVRDGLAAFGVGMTGTGVVHKAFKAGLALPPPAPQQPKPPQQWDGKAPGQML